MCRNGALIIEMSSSSVFLICTASNSHTIPIRTQRNKDLNALSSRGKLADLTPGSRRTNLFLYFSSTTEISFGGGAFHSSDSHVEFKWSSSAVLRCYFSCSMNQTGLFKERQILRRWQHNRLCLDTWIHIIPDQRIGSQFVIVIPTYLARYFEYQDITSTFVITFQFPFVRHRNIVAWYRYKNS